MAPVALAWEDSNIVPIAYFTAAAAGSLSLLGFISSTIRQSSSNLAPLSNTRQLESQRRKYVILFTTLGTTSFALVLYYTIIRYMLSYEFWVNHHGRRQEMPNALPGRSYIPANWDDSLQLGPWFTSQNVPLQFYEIIAERSRRFWWGHQFFAGLIAWSAFIGVEGQRRRFSIGLKLAFLLTAQFLSLSLAQNLFYIALLLKPVPLASQNALHTPNPSLYIIFALLGLFFIADLPLRQHTVLFNGSLFGGMIAIPALLSLLPDIVPQKFRISHKNVHLAHRSYAVVFTAISLFALASHVWFTGAAILDNTPGLHQHHRSIFSWPFHFRISHAEPTHLQRAETAITRVLGALGDHPAVNAVGWDVLLSALSLGTWCIVHGVDVDGMIECSIWPWHMSLKNNFANDHSLKRVSFDNATEKEDSDAVQSSPTKKSRGRPKKPEKDASDARKAASKMVQKADEIVSASTTKRRARKRGYQSNDDDEDAEDEDYVPDQTTAAELANLEHEEEHGEAIAEAGALVWGLCALGGLGVATAAALGSEVVMA